MLWITKNYNTQTKKPVPYISLGGAFLCLRAQALNSGCFCDSDEVFGLEAGAADEAAIDVGLCQ
jgi:hypothetical protein